MQTSTIPSAKPRLSALAQLVNPAHAGSADPTVPELLNELRKLSNDVGAISRNYSRLHHERRQRELVTLHVKIRDLHERLARHFCASDN